MAESSRVTVQGAIFAFRQISLYTGQLQFSTLQICLYVISVKNAFHFTLID